MRVCQNDWSALTRRNLTNLFKSNKLIFNITVLKDLFKFVRFLAQKATKFTFDTPSLFFEFWPKLKMNKSYNCKNYSHNTSNYSYYLCGML